MSEGAGRVFRHNCITLQTIHVTPSKVHHIRFSTLCTALPRRSRYTHTHAPHHRSRLALPALNTITKPTHEASHAAFIKAVKRLLGVRVGARSTPALCIRLLRLELRVGVFAKLQHLLTPIVEALNKGAVKERGRVDALHK